MKYRSITISGDIGTGKSSLARGLAAKLGWKVISAGEYIRNWHKENEIPLEDTTDIPEEVDRKVERDYKKLVEQEKNIVFEWRLAGWFGQDIKDILKVLCVADFDEAMKRASRREGVDLAKVEEASKIRSEGHKKKFKKLYGVENYLDKKYFDLIIDTTNLTKEEVVEKVLEKLKSN